MWSLLFMCLYCISGLKGSSHLREALFLAASKAHKGTLNCTCPSQVSALSLLYLLTPFCLKQVRWPSPRPRDWRYAPPFMERILESYDKGYGHREWIDLGKTVFQNYLIVLLKMISNTSRLGSRMLSRRISIHSTVS